MPPRPSSASQPSQHPATSFLSGTWLRPSWLRHEPLRSQVPQGPRVAMREPRQSPKQRPNPALSDAVRNLGARVLRRACGFLTAVILNAGPKQGDGQDGPAGRAQRCLLTCWRARQPPCVRKTCGLRKDRGCRPSGRRTGRCRQRSVSSNRRQARTNLTRMHSTSLARALPMPCHHPVRRPA